MSKQFIGTMLVDGGEISQEQLDHALEVQKERGGRIGVILVQERYITTGILCRYLQLQTNGAISDYREHRDREARIAASDADSGEWAEFNQEVGAAV